MNCKKGELVRVSDAGQACETPIVVFVLEIASMNCRKGDIVRVVSCNAQSPQGFAWEIPLVGFVLGMVTTAVELDGDDCWRLDPPLVVDGALIGYPKVTVNIKAMHDSLLRPIRPGPGVDEMLLIAGSPRNLEPA